MDFNKNKISELEQASTLPDVCGLDTILRLFDGGVVLCDHQGIILSCNLGFVRLLGYGNSEICLSSNVYYSFVFKEDLPQLQQAVSLRKNYTLEYRLIKKDGTVVWIKDKCAFTEENTVERLVVDISEKKYQEQALFLSEKWCQLALRFSNVTAFEYDIATKSIIFQDSDILQYKLPPRLEDAVNYFIDRGSILPESVEDYRKLYARIEQGETFARANIRVKDKKTETERLLEISLATIFDYDGSPVRALGMKKDVTKTVSLQREKDFGDTLVSDRLLVYEANVTTDRLFFYDKVWSKNLNVPNCATFSCFIREECESSISATHKSDFYKYLSRLNIISSYNEGKRLISFEYQKTFNGVTYRWFEMTINIIKDDFSGDIIIRCYITDTSEKKEKERTSLEEQIFYETMALKTTVTYEVNISRDKFILGIDNFKGLFNLDQETDCYSGLLRHARIRVLHPDDIDEFNKLLRDNLTEQFFSNNKTEITCEYRRLDKTGEFIWMASTVHLFQDPISGDLKGFMYIENIDQQKRKELNLLYQSEHDLLTGFLNKSATEKYVTEFLSSAKAQNELHAFFIVDVDRFKSINDNFGHSFGDAVLSKISAKIAGLFRDYDILGRIGGDEFIILMKNINGKKIALLKAEEICRSVCEKYVQNGVVHTISTSIGIAFCGEHGMTYEDLYLHSDAALYTSKKNGKDTYFVYSENMELMFSKTKEINESKFFENRIFEKNITEYAFRILYEAANKETGINSVLSLVGKHCNISRAYIFEEQMDGEYTSNTFEWCNDDIVPQIDKLQMVSYSTLDDYKSNFNSEGVYFMPDIELVDPALKAILEPQRIKSMVQFSIVKNGKFSGFVGFDQCDTKRVFSRQELSDLRNISNILGVFVVDMRAAAENLAMKRVALSIVDGLDSYAYVCEPSTYKLLFINKKTLALSPLAKLGQTCHQAFWDRMTPCEMCPVKNLQNSNADNCTMEMFNDVLNVWVRANATWIDWLDSKNVCLVDSVDITDYK